MILEALAGGFVGLLIGLVPVLIVNIVVIDRLTVRHDQERGRLLDRIQAPERAAYVWTGEDPLESEQPSAWLHDDTGLITSPVYASDRDGPAD